MKHIVAVLVLALTGCATGGSPQQTVYTAKSALLVGVRLATAYASLPRCPTAQPLCSDQATVVTANKAAHAADAAVEAAESVVRNPAFGPNSDAATKAAVAAEGAVDALTAITQTLKVN